MFKLHALGHQLRLCRSLLACWASLGLAWWPVQMPWTPFDGFSMHSVKLEELASQRQLMACAGLGALHGIATVSNQGGAS